MDLKLFKNRLIGRLPDGLTQLEALTLVLVDCENNHPIIVLPKLKFLDFQKEYNFYHQPHFIEDTRPGFKGWDMISDDMSNPNPNPGYQKWKQHHTPWIEWLRKPSVKQHPKSVKQFLVEIESQVTFYPQLLLFFLFREKQCLLKHLQSPTAVIKDIRDRLLLFLKKLCQAQNNNILRSLVCLWIEVDTAGKEHPLEKDLLLEFSNEIAALTKGLLHCRSFDHETKLQQLLLSRKYWGSISKSLGYGYKVDSYRRLMHVYDDDSVMNFALRYRCKFLFSILQINNMNTRLFFDHPFKGRYELIITNHTVIVSIQF